MKTLILIVVLFFVSCSSILNKKVENTNLLLGMWKYTYENGCQERWKFLSSGIRLCTSNEEYVRAKYTLETISVKNKIYLITDKVLEDNGKKDCTSSTNTEIGEIAYVYMQLFDNPQRFYFSYSAKMNNKFGPFVKND